MARSWYFFLYFLFVVTVTTTSVQHTTHSAEEVLEYINKLQGQLTLSAYQNIILVIGYTGNGKSTLVHYIASDSSQVKSVFEGTEYKVIDMLDHGGGEISTTVSRTLVPEMIVDETQNVWCDCPGFGDTRNETVEIATSVIMKSVLKNVTNVKIVLVTDYDSVTTSHSRDNFGRLLSQTMQLIKNTPRFLNSVSLVVSKTPSCIAMRRQIIEFTDVDIKKSVISFIDQYVTVLRTKKETDKIQLINALMKTDKIDDYPRISIFWRPCDEGPFDEIQKMIDGRVIIRRSILEHSSFVRVNQDELGFPLTPRALLKIREITDHSHSQIAMVLKEFDAQLIKTIHERYEPINGIENRINWIKRVANVMNSMKDTSILTSEQWVEHLSKLRDVLNDTSIINNQIKVIQRYVKNLNDLKLVAAYNNTEKHEWSARDILNSKLDWNSFCLDVFQSLKGYEYQKNTAKYNVKNIADWGKQDKEQMLTIDESNFNEFAMKFSNKYSEYTPTSSELKDVNEIIDVTIKSLPTYTCMGRWLQIRGTFVKSSDIKTEKCSSEINKITVYVVNTFYADSNLNLNGIELYIFAHTWIIQHEVKFNLNGVNGAQQGPPIEKGMAGEPGNPGGSAGNFFGFVRKILNGKSLTISLAGGDGGNGQDGTGNEDIFVSFSADSKDETGAGFLNPSNYYKKHFDSYDASFSGRRKDLSYVHPVGGGLDYYEDVTLSPNGCCGATGIGGQGGFGGYEGIFDIKFVEYVTEVPNSIISEGKKGSNGKDARTCKSSEKKVKIKGYFEAWAVLVVPMYRIRSKFTAEDVPATECPNDYRITELQMESPRPQKQLNRAESLDHFKQFLCGYEENPVFFKIVGELLGGIVLN